MDIKEAKGQKDQNPKTRTGLGTHAVVDDRSLLDAQPCGPAAQVEEASLAWLCKARTQASLAKVE